MRTRTLLFILSALLAPALAAPAGAVSAKTIGDNAFESFSQGELQSAALTSDGYLRPAYERRAIGATGSELVWDAIREPDGSVLCATGHGGALIRVNANGTTRTVARLKDVEITALAALPGGAALAAGAPSGLLYRVGADDSVTTIGRVPAAFVWRFVPAGDGSLLALTGVEGGLFRVDPASGRAESLGTLKSRNLLCAWVDAKGEFGARGAIYIGGQNPGWLYRLTPGKQTKVEVLFNSGAEEIRAIQPVEEGLALAVNTERAPTGQALQMTMRMAGGGMSPARMQPINIQLRPGLIDENTLRAMATAFNAAQQQGARPQGGSLIALLRRNGFAREFWRSPESPINDMAVAPGGRLLAAAGSQGRVYEIKPDASAAIVADVRDDFVLRLLSDERGVLLACARNGAVYDMARRPAREAVFVSRPLDAGSPARWGKFYVRGAEQALDQSAPNAGAERELKGVTVAFRTGNSGDADSDLWGNWSPEMPARNNEALPLPPNIARYLQYRVTIKTHGGALAPQIGETEAFFTKPNSAPAVVGIDIAKPVPGAKPGQPAPQQQAQQPRQPGKADDAGDVSRDARSNAMALNIAWKAVDPDNDTLRFALFFKAQDETSWKLIDDKLSAPQMPLNIGGVADGYYRFRVVASDELDNPQGEGLSDEKISDPVLVDNTPPVVSRLMASARGNKAVISCRLSDAWSVISDLRVDIDNKDAYPVFPSDGIFDEKTEDFEWTTPALPPGEHTATLNGTDREGNTVTARIVFTTKGE